MVDMVVVHNSLLTQNGGEFSQGSGGRNYPLRGEKNSIWEGGTRVTSFLHSPLIKKRGNSYNGRVTAIYLKGIFVDKVKNEKSFTQIGPCH